MSAIANLKKKRIKLKQEFYSIERNLCTFIFRFVFLDLNFNYSNYEKNAANINNFSLAFTFHHVQISSIRYAANNNNFSAEER